MSTLLRKYAWAPFVLWALTSCTEAQTTQTIWAEVVTPDENFSNYSLNEVQIENVENIRNLEHQRFKFLGGGFLSGDDLQNFLAVSSDSKELAASTRSAFAQTLSVDFTEAYDVYRANDFDSLLALSAFAGINNVWNWYVDVVGDTSSATTEKGYVVFYGDVIPSRLLPLPMVQMDNAVYLAGVDAWMIFPVGNQEGVPYAMNHGVLAHEFHHRVFFQSVWASHAFERWKSVLNTEAKISTDEQRSLNLLRALDEGLADINAIGFTQNITFMNPSFINDHVDEFTKTLLDAESQRRNIESNFSDAATYDNIREDALEHELFNGCGQANNYETTGDILSGDVWSPYCLGSVIARTLWDGTGRNFNVLNEIFLPAINRSLNELGIVLSTGKSFDVDVFWDLFIAELPMDFDIQGLCENIHLKFLSLSDSGRVPACQKF